jgi:hypothetical protein
MLLDFSEYIWLHLPSLDNLLCVQSGGCCHLNATRMFNVSRRNARKLIAEHEAGLGLGQSLVPYIVIGQCWRSYAFIPGAETGPRLCISIADIFLRTSETAGFVPFPFTLSLTRRTSSFGVNDCSVTHGITKVDGRAYPKHLPEVVGSRYLSHKQ